MKNQDWFKISIGEYFIHLMVLLIVIFAALTIPSGKTAIALVLLPVAFIDRDKAMFVLIALFLIRMSNPAITGLDPQLSISAWMTSLIASSRIWLDFILNQRHRTIHQLKWISLFSLIVLILSVFSLSPIVSILKIFGFYFIAVAIIIGFISTSHNKSITIAWLYAAWASVIITSIFTLPFPEVGYFRDGQGFQGSLNHPQLLAIFISPVAAFIIIKILTEKRLSISSIIILGAVVSILILTRARTGIASIILGFFILGLFKKNSIKFLANWLKRRKTIIILIFLALLASPALYKYLQSDIEEYIFKSASSQELGAAFNESRGFIILQAMRNIEDRPITGIGFGVAKSESHEFNPEIEPVTGLPIGAPTEKANLIIAIIEETGIIGTAAFAIFFLSFLRAIANSENIALASAAITSVCTNISEMTFFSMGGAGVYTWIICAIAISLSPSQHRYAKIKKPILNQTTRTRVYS